MELSLKLSMLLALVSSQMKQALLQLNINNDYLKKSDEEFVFILSRHANKVDPIIQFPFDHSQTYFGYSHMSLCLFRGLYRENNVFTS